MSTDQAAPATAPDPGNPAMEASPSLTAGPTTAPATPAAENQSVVMAFLTSLGDAVKDIKQTVTGLADTVQVQGNLMANLEGRINIVTGGINTGLAGLLFGHGTPNTPTLGRPRSLFDTLMLEMPRQNTPQAGQGPIPLTPLNGPSPADTAAAASNNAASAVTMTATRMYKAPDPLGDADIAKPRDVLMANFDRMVMLVTMMCGVKEGPSLRELVPLFKDDPCKWFCTYATAVGLDARGPDVMTQLREAFQARFTGEVRSDESIALDLLLNKRIVQQQGETVAAYAERFQAIARKLPMESDASMCRHYVRGLQPHLAERCCVDKDDNEWSSLPALIKHSLAQDLRVQTVRHIRSLQGTTHGSKGRFFDKNRSNRSPQDQAQAHVAMDVDEAVVTAAPVTVLQGPMAESDNPYTDRRPLTWDSVPKYAHVKGKPLQAPPGLRPVEECPAYNCPGSLRDKFKERSLLSAWFMCPFCRKGRHSADDCPKNNSAAKKRQAEGGVGGSGQPIKKK